MINFKNTSLLNCVTNNHKMHKTRDLCEALLHYLTSRRHPTVHLQLQKENAQLMDTILPCPLPDVKLLEELHEKKNNKRSN